MCLPLYSILLFPSKKRSRWCVNLRLSYGYTLFIKYTPDVNKLPSGIVLI